MEKHANCLSLNIIEWRNMYKYRSGTTLSFILCNIVQFLSNYFFPASSVRVVHVGLPLNLIFDNLSTAL